MLFVYKILNSINLIISEKFVNNRVVESETISAGKNMFSKLHFKQVKYY